MIIYLHTDILFGRDNGLQTVLTLTGVTSIPEDGAAVSVGMTVGSAVGASVGSLEGTTVGTNVGLIVG